jgi:hypothetical protein
MSALQTSVRLLMHAGTSNEYTVTVPTASQLTKVGPTYVPSKAMSYRPPPGQPDQWTLRVPDAGGDGYHRWEYTHVHAASEACRKYEQERERAKIERERERQRERERVVVIRRSLARY